MFFSSVYFLTVSQGMKLPKDLSIVKFSASFLPKSPLFSGIHISSTALCWTSFTIESWHSQTSFDLTLLKKCVNYCSFYLCFSTYWSLLKIKLKKTVIYYQRLKETLLPQPNTSVSVDSLILKYLPGIEK